MVERKAVDVNVATVIVVLALVEGDALEVDVEEAVVDDLEEVVVVPGASERVNWAD